MVSDEEYLIGAWLFGQRHFADNLMGRTVSTKTLPVLLATMQWLDEYFAQQNPQRKLPIAPVGNDFRRLVWELLLEIPYGSIVTYGELARKIAQKMNKSHMSAQAVGGAIGHNPLTIIIPCHRVVGRDGSLVGYAGGMSSKLKLLELEGVDTSSLFIPGKNKDTYEQGTLDFE